MLKNCLENHLNRRNYICNELVQREMACQKKEEWESLLIKYLGPGENLQVLNVGIRSGFIAILLAGLNYSVTGINKCQDILDQARETVVAAGKNIRFLKADPHAIDLSDMSVDAIVSRNAIGLLANPIEVYQEWYRLLKPAGKVLVFDANWYLHFNDPKLQRQCDKYRRLAIKKGYQGRISLEQQELSDKIVGKLPLSHEIRPLWDHGAFCRCGFGKIEVEEDISKLVWNELEQILYYPTPMFAICATKLM